MKALISLAALAMFSVAMVGCHASADVDSPDHAGTDSHYKKTTTYDNGGTKTTETKTTVNP